MTEPRALVERIAVRLGNARRERGLTLRTLSEKTGLSQPFLSRLERARVSTSIANLILITRTIGIDLGTLFQEEAEAATPKPYVLSRAADRQPPHVVPATGYTYQPVAAAWMGQMMDAFVLTFPVGNQDDVLTAHDGEELSFVLQGEILFQLGGDQVRLGAGDCLYFNAEVPHMGRNVGNVDAKVLMVTAPGRGPGREFGWWKVPVAPAERPKAAPGGASGARAAPRGRRTRRRASKR